MITIIFVGAIALILGIVFDALGTLHYFLVVMSLLAVVSAGLMMLASGLNVLQIAMGSLGLSGLLSSWDRIFSAD